MDAKDILGLPKHSLPIPQEKKSRPHKDSQRKPDGISREVYALTGGVAPLMPSVDVNQLKKRHQPENEKITWEWLSFTSSARKDDLKLYHWVRVVNGTPPTGDYQFAKYNKSVDVIKYTDEEYEKHLTDPVISRAILIARAPSPADVSSHPLVKEPYNITQEIERKRALSMVLSQTKHQERKDADAAQDAELAITLNASPEHMEKTTAPVETGSPSNIQAASGVAPLMSMADNAAAAAASLRSLRVYLRTYALDQMVQAASSSAGLRTIKRVEQFLQELKVNLKPKVPTKAVCAEHLELRKEILTLLNLQKLLQNKEEGSSYREGSYTETPDTPKRLQRGIDQDRTFVPDSVSFGAISTERVGKRDQKRKGPGREAPSSPAQSNKRPRKLKTTDSHQENRNQY
ncbi:hypothetical protein M8C21_007597 [Ambrosia artemisiifolia]|uniref:DNA methyltransferase 1-associated 1 domain-containing protein n=1 Tax=Ambrosia artemisiifolia TaxID=4212 RepID=A0AAD5CV19_AMBAR|nr:hypothetical protein M8C21_007597 [Ambrosia artemisiifolia]